MPLTIVCRSSKINQLYSLVCWQHVILDLVVGGLMEVIRTEQYIFGLKVCMRISISMHEGNSLEELPSEGLD